MEIAAGINTGPCGVILLGDLPGEGKQTVHLLSSFIIPGFIKRAPAYDGGMVEIPFNSLDPLGNKGLIAGIGGVVKAPVGHSPQAR